MSRWHTPSCSARSRIHVIWLGCDGHTVPALQPGDLVVVIFHDHGTRYLGKMFNDDWMKKKGFLQREGLTARDLVANKRTVPLMTIEHTDTIAHAAQVMTAHDFSQVPVTSNGRIIGSVNEAKLYAKMIGDPSSRTQAVETVMQGAFPFLDITAPIDALRESGSELANLPEGSKAGLDRLTRREVLAAAIHMHRSDGDEETANIDAVAHAPGLHDGQVLESERRRCGVEIVELELQVTRV